METVDVTPCTLSEVLPFLAHITRTKSDTSMGLSSVQDMCAGAQAFKVEHRGHPIGGYAIKAVEHDRGTCLWISGGAGNLGGVDLTQTMVQVVEAQAHQIGAKQIGMLTRRRGLMKKLAAQGWQIAGVQMVKKI